jgi:GNAT superfamily N-acetyltransferase
VPDATVVAEMREAGRARAATTPRQDGRLMGSQPTGALGRDGARSVGEHGPRQATTRVLYVAETHMGDDAIIPDRILVRPFAIEDWPSVWAIIHDVATRAQTFAYEPDMREDHARQMWITPAPGRVVVAVDSDADRVLGTANMYANRPGPGSHVASGSIMVAADARRRGVGRALSRDVIDWARESGFAAVQFNAVVETNAPAVRLYESLGFRILGTAPGAFAHPSLGRVGLHVMWLDL